MLLRTSGCTSGGPKGYESARRTGGMQSQAPAPPVPERTAHPFVTHDMIQEIPATVRATLQKAKEPAAAAARILDHRSRLYFTGCGTAFFSALLAQQLTAAIASGRTTSAAVPALELSGYTSNVDRTCGVIGLSHSGITKTTVDALRSARERGAATVGVTHFPERPISAASDETIVVGNSPDRSRCHTKCYIAGAMGAALVGLTRLAAEGAPQGKVDELIAGFHELPDLQAKVLRTSEKECERLAASHLERKSTFLVGFGPNEPTALEAALKLMETSFIQAQGMETEQFLHGHTQALDSDSVVFAIVSAGPGRSRSLDLLRAARALGAHTVAVAPEDDREAEAISETTLTVPKVDERLSPFLNILPLYLYAYHASVMRGHNPDVLRYLEPRYWAARNIVFPPGTH